MSSLLEKLFLTDPIRFAFEMYDLMFDQTNDKPRPLGRGGGQITNVIIPSPNIFEAVS